MQRRHVLIANEQMERNIHCWAFGHAGPPLLAFPTAAGMAHEWDKHGMIDALAPLVEAGRLRIYCPESNVSVAWTDAERHPAERMELHRRYERFVIESFVPKVRIDAGLPADAPIACAGASLGGMYAGLFALKFPDVFDWALCMSGRYLATAFTGGFSNLDVYYNNPLAFVPNLQGAELHRVYRTHLVLVCGRGKWEGGCIEETEALADLCAAKAIPHTRDIWGHDSYHDWPWWFRQARHHLGMRFP
jgi:esterase/lipase superfamily enzyme